MSRLRGRRGLPTAKDPRREIDEEIRFHIEGAVEDLMAEGVPEDEARRRILDEFGDIDEVRARCRAIAEERLRRERREDVMEAFVRDLRLAGRRLRRRPGFTAAAVITLALGIGATVAMFSVVQSVVLRPLPYPESERLVRVWPAMNFNIALVDYFRDADAYRHVTGLSRWSFTLTGEGDPEQVEGIAVHPDYFPTFGVQPALGRALAPEERFHGRDDVALLSWDFWQRRFGGDPGVVGRQIGLDGHDTLTREVIGVMPRGHQPPGEPVDVWVPLVTAPGYTVAQDSAWYVNEVVARLSPGASLEEARAEVRTLARRARTDFPGRIEEEYVAAADVQRLLDSLVGGDVRFGLWILLGAVALVLVMACTNVANLLLARSTERATDLALRAALGASRGRLVRQGLTEGVLLAVLGGGLGVLLAWWGLSLARSGVALALPRGGSVSMSLPVLFFAAGVTLVSVLGFALLPALRSTAGDAADALKEGGRGPSTNRSSNRLRSALVAAQVALAVVVVTGAGLMVRSFWSLYRTDPGFEAQGVLLVQVAGSGGETEARREALVRYYEEVHRRLEAVPGLQEVGGIHLLPLTGGNWSFPYLAQGHQPPSDGPLPSANFRIITPGYFRTMGIPLLSGRDVSWSDRGEGAQVGLINQAMARELWPGEEAVGKVINLFGNMPFEVVGVVGDVRQFSLEREAVPEMYRPLTQFSPGHMNFMVRPRAGDAASLVPAIRQAVWDVDPSVPITRLAPVGDLIDDSVARSRFFAALLAGFGGLALLLGAVGVYGVMAYAVATRVPEFGVRLALGAAPSSVVRSAMKGGLIPVVVGIAGGLALALAGGRLLSSLLYGVSPTDPVTLVGVTAVLGSVACAAAFLPARRASRVDPVRVLNAE